MDIYAYKVAQNPATGNWELKKLSLTLVRSFAKRWMIFRIFFSQMCNRMPLM